MDALYITCIQRTTRNARGRISIRSPDLFESELVREVDGMSTLILSKKEVLDLLDMGEVIAAVEESFRLWARGEALMPPKSYLDVPDGDFRAMPAYLPGSAGLKWVNVHPGNARRGIPTVMAVLIYNDPATGYPLAVMDATEITAFRTGAAAAIASRYLARLDSHTLGLVGAGRQAYTQLQAHTEIFSFELIRVFDIFPERVERMIDAFPDYPIVSCSLPETAASDILCTLTPARQPVIKRAWIRPGTHINAVGADAHGKQELETSLLKTGIVFVDDIVQAAASGEINVPIASGTFTIDDVRGTLGEVVSGVKKGRPSVDSITIFDATGVAVEDLACARLIYQKTLDKPGYVRLDLVE